MITRYMENKDAFEHEKVASQAYIFGVDFSRKLELPCARMIGCFDDDDKTLMADMEIYKYVCYYFGNELSCAAVGGVASRPEYRNRGAVRTLFNHLYNHSSFDISILYPFSSYFYGKMGYTSMGLFAELEVPFKEFSHIERNSSVRLLTEDFDDEILEVYNEWSVNNNLSFFRSNLNYFSTRPFESCVYTYLWYGTNGKASSYITFSADRKNRTINVSEVGFCDCASLKGVLGFLRNYEGNYDKIIFERIPSFSPVFNLIDNVERTKITMHNVGAARIINPINVLSKVVYPEDSGRFVIKIDDPNGPADGTFSVSFKNKVGEVAKCDDDPDYVMDILTANKLLLCGISHTDLIFNDGLKIMKENNDFIRSFPHKDTFFVGGF